MMSMPGESLNHQEKRQPSRRNFLVGVRNSLLGVLASKVETFALKPAAKQVEEPPTPQPELVTSQEQMFEETPYVDLDFSGNDPEVMNKLWETFEIYADRESYQEGEDQMYKRENVIYEAPITDENGTILVPGFLRLKAKIERYMGRYYTSGRIQTKQSEAVNGVMIKVKLKAPLGAGCWPAAWLYQSEAARAALQAKVNRADLANDAAFSQLGGEIDFFEAAGALRDQYFTNLRSYSTIVSGGERKVTYHEQPNLHTQYHEFFIQMLDDRILMGVDGQVRSQHINPMTAVEGWTPDAPETKTQEIANWPWRDPESSSIFILNLAMGGKFSEAYDPTNSLPEGIDNSLESFWNMDIQSIQMYGPKADQAETP